MNLENYQRITGLRYDHTLKSFSNLMSFYFGAPERLAKTEQKCVATGPLCPPEIIFSAGAVPNDICTREGLTKSILRQGSEFTARAIDAGISPEISPWHLLMSG